MNKKFFTLLAGAFLMFAVVLSVKAQVGHGLWDQNRLSLGDSVRTLSLGMNSGYYHLRVDSVISTTGPNINYVDTANQDSTFVLFMGQSQLDGRSLLFVDSIGAVDYSNWGIGTNSPFRTNAKAERSAASLWCVDIQSYDQGQNITFDFVNKEHQQQLEVDYNNYEGWGKPIDPLDKAEHAAKAFAPGGISGWAFSGTYATHLGSAPLLSYITADTVAVLCLDQNTTSRGDSVYVKIADVNDVREGRVDGVIYFRLMNAAPFVVDANDYNSVFGRNRTDKTLTFSPDVDGRTYTNPFSGTNLTASYLPTGETGMRIVESGWHPYFSTAPRNTPDTITGGVQNYDTIRYTSEHLDSLGYLRFAAANGQQVQVLRNFFPDNTQGNQYLQVGLGTAYSTNDSLYYGQYAFRMVYYPSGDSIYINPYQATYVPMAQEIRTRYGAYTWTDSASLSSFTYYADTAALDTIGGVWAASNATIGKLTARLKYGNRTSNFYGPFLPYHRLYVGLQDLTDANRRLTLITSNARNHTINTQINFGLYSPCAERDGRPETTVPPNVYLIRNTAGEYLQVPLYSATDSAVWVVLEENEDPRYVPSFHWVVERRYPNSEISPVDITNREFDELKFSNVQLYNDIRPIRLRNETYAWNTKNVNAANVTTWANKDNNNFAFISLDREFKNNPYLGYEYIHPDTAVVSQYAFNYRNRLDTTRYIGWQGDDKAYPNTDTLLYVYYDNYFDKMYFSLDTINEPGYGGLQTYGFNANGTNQIADLVTLQRQAYRLSYKDPYKYNCITEFCMAPGEEKYYGLTKRGYYRDILGKPVFYLRHHYKQANDVPYFTLVQRIDSTTTNPRNDTDTTALRAYLNQVFGAQAANIVMNQIRKAGKVNPGLFVAAFEDATAKLKMELRADASLNSVSAFKLERDNDPIYRRFNTTKEADEANDDPKLLRFYSATNTDYFLFENRGNIQNQYNYWVNGQKNYLGIVLTTEPAHVEANSSTTIYVDTAFVNRGTGYIKPQYLLAVRPTIVEPAWGCDDMGEPTIPLAGYLEAYYLINAWDSAYNDGTNTVNTDYLWEDSWTRLVFTRAIHANDYLYILGNTDLTNADVYGKLTSGVQQFDLNKLHTYALRADNDIKAIYLGNNLHKDVVFSMRLTERGSDDFIIESETTDRDTINGPMIAPCEGGWIKNQNGVPVISMSDEVEGMVQGLRMNVLRAGENDRPTGNEDVATSNVTVVGNTGAVTILNAAGKNVVINNILGQQVAAKVLTSDNETITVSQGIVIVSIEGEEAVKTLVK